LARYARLDPNILRPLDHHTVAQQEALTLIGARAGVGFGMVNSAITNNAVSGMPLSQAEVAAAIASTSRGGSVAVTGTIIDAIHKGSMTFTPVTHLAWSAFSFSTRMGFERALGSHQGKPLCTC
jgi:hypothetical protein